MLLSECILNLSELNNFDFIIRKLRAAKNFIEFESSFAEILVAKCLFLAGMPVFFVKNSGIRGFDFDIETQFRNGSTVAVEVKCKTNIYQINPKSFIDTIQDAIPQMASSKAKIIFIKIPEGWSSLIEFDRWRIDNTMTLFESQLLEKSDVHYFWETERLKDGVASRSFRMRSFCNATNFDFNPLASFSIALENSEPTREYISITNLSKIAITK